MTAYDNLIIAIHYCNILTKIKITTNPTKGSKRVTDCKALHVLTAATALGRYFPFD
jgi:hypothetical protein